MRYTTFATKAALSILIPSISVLTLSFKQLPSPVKTLKGSWVYTGGIYNGKPTGAPKEYKMQRNYTDNNFAAFASQQGYKTERYEAGNYTLKGDTCFETSTYSSRPSQLVGKVVAYTFKVTSNELVFSGKLPSGMVVEEHWKKVGATNKHKN